MKIFNYLNFLVISAMFEYNYIDLGDVYEIKNFYNL